MHRNAPVGSGANVKEDERFFYKSKIQISAIASAAERWHCFFYAVQETIPGTTLFVNSEPSQEKNVKVSPQIINYHPIIT